MARRKTSRAEVTRLPELLRPLFWEYMVGRLSLERDRELIMEKVLARGTWEQIRWLRGGFGDAVIREFLVRRRGAGLSPRQLAFWQLILDLPRREVNGWLAAPGRQVWDHRVRR